MIHEDSDLCSFNFVFTPRKTTRKRIPNTRIINAAVICIRKLEKSLHVQNRIYESLISGNKILKEKLAEMKQTEYSGIQGRPSLFHCDMCRPAINLKGPKEYFLHHMESHPDAETKQTPAVKMQNKKAVDLRTPDPLYCRCNKSHLNPSDSLGLQIHNLLHQDLILFHCPVFKCDKLFGVPSNLKRHYFLDHGTVLPSAEKHIIDYSARVRITRSVKG